MPSTVEEKDGTIASFYDANTGIVNESGTTSQHEFFQNGAQVDFTINELIVLVKVTTPSGNVIITQIKKK